MHRREVGKAEGATYVPSRRARLHWDLGPTCERRRSRSGHHLIRSARRKRHVEGGLLPWRALHPDAPLVRHHELARDVESDANSPHARVPRALGAHEAVEEMLDLLARNSLAVVLDGDVHLAAALLDAHVDLRS